MTPYERSFRQYEIYCTKNKVKEEKVKTVETVIAFLKACKSGYPNGVEKEFNTLKSKANGIVHTMKTRGFLNQELKFKLTEEALA